MANWKSQEEMIAALRKNMSADDIERAEAIARRAARSQRRLLSHRLNETDMVDVISNTLIVDLKERESLYWVNWSTTRVEDEDWPSDTDGYVFARGRTRTERVQTWSYPSQAMAAALCRELWGLELEAPPGS
jgi:hypothetical protein